MQGYQRGNQIQQAFTQRGLGASGLAQYGNIQNRQAMGQSINQLASQNAEVARAAMDASRGISQNLQNTLMKARLQANAQNIESDQMLYQQQQAEQQNIYQRALEYMNLSGIDPTSEQGMAIVKQLFAGQLPADLQAQLESAANAPVDVLGGGVKRSGLNWYDKWISTWAEGASDFLNLGRNESARNAGARYFKYTINGEQKNYKSANEAQADIARIYGNKQYMNASNTGQIRVFVDAASGRVVFIDAKTNTQSKTYNDAVAKLTGSK